MFKRKASTSSSLDFPCFAVDDKAQAAEHEQTRPHSALTIDEITASPWVGLHFRHEFLLHYQHELLEYRPHRP